MSTINKAILIGHLGRDPELKTFDGGGKICNFSIATTETYTNKNTGEKISNTEWHNIVAKNKLAELCDKYLHKGSKVYVEGRIKTREYELDGSKRYITQIEVSDITFLGSANNTQTNTPESINNNNQSEVNDSLPF